MPKEKRVLDWIKTVNTYGHLSKFIGGLNDQSFPKSISKVGRTFKMSYSYTKMGLIKQHNQREATATMNNFHRVNSSSMNARLQNFLK